MGAKKLTNLEVLEGSIVDDPANPLAKVLFFKSAGTRGSAADELETIAKRKVTAGVAIDLADGLRKAARENPELYRRHVDETRQD